MVTAETVNKAIATASVEDTRTPNQKRLDDLLDGQEEMIVELQKINKNLAIVGAALLKVIENNKKPGSKKSVDKG